jgi:hypothetical protein
MDSWRTNWLVPALILVTTFFVPMAYIHWNTLIFGIFGNWLVFVWGVFYIGNSRAETIDYVPSTFDFGAVLGLILFWIAVGIVLLIVVHRDLEGHRNPFSLLISLLALVLQILLPILVLDMAAEAYIGVMVPLPIPSLTSLVALLLVSHGSSGRSEEAGEN